MSIVKGAVAAQRIQDLKSGECSLGPSFLDWQGDANAG